jgi:hypothetical protein
MKALHESVKSKKSLADKYFEDLGYIKEEAYNGYKYIEPTTKRCLKITNMNRLDIYYDDSPDGDYFQLQLSELLACILQFSELENESSLSNATDKSKQLKDIIGNKIDELKRNHNGDDFSITNVINILKAIGDSVED